MNNNINRAHITSLIVNVFKNTNKVYFLPCHWTFSSKDGKQTVEFISNNHECKYVYTRIKKFMFLTIGSESFTLSSNELEIPLWHELGDLMYNTIARFGVNE